MARVSVVVAGVAATSQRAARGVNGDGLPLPQVMWDSATLQRMSFPAVRAGFRNRSLQAAVDALRGFERTTNVEWCSKRFAGTLISRIVNGASARFVSSCCLPRGPVPRAAAYYAVSTDTGH